jgi:mono/diheme cytochrome c family protein
MSRHRSALPFPVSSVLGLALVLAPWNNHPVAASEDPEFYQKSVRPILEEHCFDCHGPEKQKNKLRLDTTVGILRGGESGEPLLLAGHSADSYLLKRVTSTNPKDQMPPKGERLREEELEVLRRWIDSGASLSGAVEAARELRIKTDHWSFQPVKRTDPPVRDQRFGNNAIDGFVLAKLREKGLEPSPQADPRTLVRRLYLLMHGMPPTPAEVEEYLADKNPDAWARLVDRVLASPRYGERWARHWMDVVRYADTDGFERNVERKSAYPYRDYLVESFNADKPYNQFVKEQIAGDMLGVDRATGFLVAGPFDSVKSSDTNLTLMQRQEELADMVNTTGTAFLGLTMGCARCHNHKFDPILQKDYYAIQAVFAGVQMGERSLREMTTPEDAAVLEKLRATAKARGAELDALKKKAQSVQEVAVKEKDGLRPPVVAVRNEDAFEPVEACAVRFTILATSGAEPCLDELEVFDTDGKNVALTLNGGKASASGTLQGYPIHQLVHINDGKYGNPHSWISNSKGSGWVQIDFPAKVRVSRVAWSRDRDGLLSDRLPTRYKIEAATEPGEWKQVGSSDGRRVGVGPAVGPNAFLAKLSHEDAAAAKKLQADIAALQEQVDARQHSAWVGRFNPQPERTHRLYRGEPLQKREVVAPDALSVLGTLGLDVDAPDAVRRMRFAEWAASESNPLTARVLVNRLWHYIFGNGLVDTPSDLGVNGSRPTHPELLDWLADEFVRRGWSVKEMQRQILLSATFQQGSAPRPEAEKRDADGRLLWRFTPRRLEAEAIRDSMLAVSGALDLRMGGSGFYLMDVVRENVRHYFPKEKYTPEEYRRMVYLFRVRAAQDGVFGAFDCPDGGSVMAKRSRSNTPLQALNLFNSTFAEGQGTLLQQRLEKEAGGHLSEQVRLAFELFYARRPDAWEQERSQAFVREHGLPSFVRALYNTSEFLFVF